MRLEARKHVEDIRRAARTIAEFTAGKTFTDYNGDALLRSGVERQFEIIGEALKRLQATDAVAAQQISQAKRIIAFRNILAHGYDVVKNEVVWDIIEHDLPELRQETDKLIDA